MGRFGRRPGVSAGRTAGFGGVLAVGRRCLLAVLRGLGGVLAVGRGCILAVARGMPGGVLAVLRLPESIPRRLGAVGRRGLDWGIAHEAVLCVSMRSANGIRDPALPPAWFSSTVPRPGRRVDHSGEVFSSLFVALRWRRGCPGAATIRRFPVGGRPVRPRLAANQACAFGSHMSTSPPG